MRGSGGKEEEDLQGARQQGGEGGRLRPGEQVMELGATGHSCRWQALNRQV